MSALARLLIIVHFWSVPAGQTEIWVFIATIVLLSFTTPGVPGGTSYQSVPAFLAAGCPIEAVVLLEVFEPVSDICKTVLNVTGDLSIAAIVTRWWGGRAPSRSLAPSETAQETAAS